MNVFLAGAMALAAGAVLVLQGELLAIISQRHGVWLALFVNSIVGMPIILALAAQNNRSNFVRLLENARWWYLLPGLLGTCFVASNVVAYAKLGPLAAASLIITAQLTTAMIFDCFSLSGMSHTVSMQRVLGVGIMLCGCLLAIKR